MVQFNVPACYHIVLSPNKQEVLITNRMPCHISNDISIDEEIKPLPFPLQFASTLNRDTKPIQFHYSITMDMSHR